MPCRSDYMEQSNYEKEISKTVKSLIYLTNELGETNTKEMADAYTQTYFTKEEGDKWVAMLCSKIRILSKEQMESIVFNGHSNKARKLADWWEEHEKADNKRINKDAVRREKAWKKFYKDNNLSSITSSQSMTKGVIKWFVDNGYEVPKLSKER